MPSVKKSLLPFEIPCSIIKQLFPLECFSQGPSEILQFNNIMKIHLICPLFWNNWKTILLYILYDNSSIPEGTVTSMSSCNLVYSMLNISNASNCSPCVFPEDPLPLMQNVVFVLILYYIASAVLSLMFQLNLDSPLKFLLTFCPIFYVICKFDHHILILSSKQFINTLNITGHRMKPCSMLQHLLPAFVESLIYTI